jgi:hypothetical protein
MHVRNCLRVLTFLFSKLTLTTTRARIARAGTRRYDTPHPPPEATPLAGVGFIPSPHPAGSTKKIPENERGVARTSVSGLIEVIPASIG